VDLGAIKIALNKGFFDVNCEPSVPRMEHHYREPNLSIWNTKEVYSNSSG